MDKRKFWLRKGAAALMLVAISGCYSYKEPAVATFGDSYSARQKDAADDILKDITVLSLRDAQKIAIKNNPTYIAAYHAVEAARMKYLQAWGAYSPTVTAGYSLAYTPQWNIISGPNPRADFFTQGVTARADLLIFDGLSRFFKLKAAKSGFDYQARMEEDACRNMMEAVAYAYNAVLLAIENRRIALEDRDFQKSSLENTRHKFEAGAAPLSDVLNFEIYVNSAEVSLVAADYQYEVAIYALAQLMGYPEGTLPSTVKFPTDYKTTFADLPAVEIYLDAALANRPDLKAYREQLNIAKYQVYQAWGAYSPVVKGFFQFNYGFSDIDNRTVRNETSEIGVGFTAEWTLFNGAIRLNKLREAKAQRAVAEYQVAEKWFAVVSEVRSAYANYVQNVRKTRLFAKIRSLSAEQRNLVDEEYKAGKAELTRLNEAQRDLVEAETSLASSYISIQNAKAQLTSVVGGTSADYYLNNESGDGRYPGLDGVEDVVANAGQKGSAGQTAPVKAPDVKRDFSQKPAAAAPAIPASATAPAVK